jgi:hypothetical protein
MLKTLLDWIRAAFASRPHPLCTYAAYFPVNVGLRLAKKALTASL